MTGGSIRFRLWSAAAISILVALAIAGVGLRYLFERHVERRVESELTVDLNQLIGATTFAPTARLAVAPVLTDPRFANPLSGYYWQVEDIATGSLDPLALAVGRGARRCRPERPAASCAGRGDHRSRRRRC